MPLSCQQTHLEGKLHAKAIGIQNKPKAKPRAKVADVKIQPQQQRPKVEDVIVNLGGVIINLTELRRKRGLRKQHASQPETEPETEPSYSQPVPSLVKKSRLVLKTKSQFRPASQPVGKHPASKETGKHHETLRKTKEQPKVGLQSEFPPLKERQELALAVGNRPRVKNTLPTKGSNRVTQYMSKNVRFVCISHFLTLLKVGWPNKTYIDSTANVNPSFSRHGSIL